MRSTQVLVVFLGLLAWAESPAAACSCLRPTLARQTLPADGATDFPPSGRIRIFLTGGWPRAIASRLAEEYRLVEDDAAAIEEPIFATLDGTLLTLAPARPLKPRTRYGLLRAQAGDAAGTLLTDDQRQDLAARGQSATTRHFAPEVHFTTGEKDDTRPPVATVVTAKADFTYPKGSSAMSPCGPGATFTLRYHLEHAARPGDIVAVEWRGHGIVAHFPLRGQSDDAELTFGDMLCTADKVSLSGEGPFAFRLVVVAASGRRSPGVSFAKATGGLASPATFRRPGEWSGTSPKQAGELVEHWLAPPITAPFIGPPAVQNEHAEPGFAPHRNP